jgi:hypothetical protein
METLARALVQVAELVLCIGELIFLFPQQVIILLLLVSLEQLVELLAQWIVSMPGGVILLLLALLHMVVVAQEPQLIQTMEHLEIFHQRYLVMADLALPFITERI